MLNSHHCAIIESWRSHGDHWVPLLASPGTSPACCEPLVGDCMSAGCYDAHLSLHILLGDGIILFSGISAGYVSEPELFG